MTIETIQAGKATALDRLIPTTHTDYSLLNCLLDDALAVLHYEGLLSEHGEVARSKWEDDGRCRLELNVRKQGKLDRISICVCFCISVTYDGTQEHRTLFDLVEQSDSNCKPKTIGQVISSWLLGGTNVDT